MYACGCLSSSLSLCLYLSVTQLSVSYILIFDLHTCVLSLLMYLTFFLSPSLNMLYVFYIFSSLSHSLCIAFHHELLALFLFIVPKSHCCLCLSLFSLPISTFSLTYLDAATESVSMLSSIPIKSSWETLLDIRDDIARDEGICDDVTGPRPTPTWRTIFWSCAMPGFVTIVQPHNTSIWLKIYLILNHYHDFTYKWEWRGLTILTFPWRHKWKP